MEKPFYTAIDKIYFDGSDNRLYQLDYFRKRKAAEHWANTNGGRVVETTPHSIWRVHRVTTHREGRAHV